MSFLQSETFITNPAFETAKPRTLLEPPADLVVFRNVERGKRIDGYGDAAHRLLTTEGERFLFLKMNYLKFRASRARSEKKRSSYLVEANAVRDVIAECNYGLVISVAHRFSGQLDVDEVISECCVVLLKAIDKFDVGRGFKFSTYATHSLQRRAFRMYQRQSKRRMSGLQTEMLEETIAEPPREETFLGTEPAKIESVIREVEECLNGRERYVLRHRYGLDGPAEKLREVAEKLGVTKERVRQIQMKAIAKVQEAMSARRVDLPGVA